MFRILFLATAAISLSQLSVVNPALAQHYVLTVGYIARSDGIANGPNASDTDILGVGIKSSSGDTYTGGIGPKFLRKSPGQTGASLSTPPIGVPFDNAATMTMTIVVSSRGDSENAGAIKTVVMSGVVITYNGVQLANGVPGSSPEGPNKWQIVLANGGPGTNSSNSNGTIKLTPLCDTKVHDDIQLHLTMLP